METEYAQPAITAYFEIFHNKVKYLNVHLPQHSKIPKCASAARQRARVSPRGGGSRRMD